MPAIRTLVNSTNYIIGIMTLGLALSFSSPAKAEDIDCRDAVREHLNLAIGFYRVEIAASHFVSQYEAAQQDAKRKKKLEDALSALGDLNKNLNNQLGQIIATPDANGLCKNIAPVLTNLHAALSTYSQVVQDRWQFMQNRLILLKQLQPGQMLQGDMHETELWVEEPRARYDIWRNLAQTRKISQETSSALYVLGMLSRIEWHTAMALYSSLHPGQKSLLPPEKHIVNAVKDTEALRSNWPSPSGSINNTLWSSLNTIAKALPNTTLQDIPQNQPAQGWAEWVGIWIDNYGKVFTHAIPKVLVSLEDVAAKKGNH